MSQVPTKRMPLSELESSMEYLKLSPKMRVFVSSYIGTFLMSGNLEPTFAAHQAYDCKDDESARPQGHRLMQNQKIKDCLKVYFDYGKSEREKDLEQVEIAIRKAEPGSVAHQRLLSIRTTIKTAASYNGQAIEPSTSGPAVHPESAKDSRIPKDAVSVFKKDGVVIGYKLADGRKVRLSDVEVKA